MKTSLTFTPLFLAIAATIVPFAHAADTTPADGFVEGSSFKINTRNYYMNRDRHDIHTDDSKEWGQGFLGIFESGYTQGTVGFGLDAHAMLGLKLDGGGGTDGSSILPYGSGNGKAPGSFSTAGGTLKMRAFDTELKAGDLFLNNPVIAGGMTRMLPQTFRGMSLTNHSFDGWMLEGGQASFTKPYNQSGHQRIGASYGDLGGHDSQHLNWAGVTWSGVPSLTSSLYASELKDVWNQYYYDLDYTYAVNDLVSLNPGLHFYHTQDTGNALLGNIDNNAYSLHFTVGVGNHAVTAAYQRVKGNTPFDYIAQGDSIFLDNSQQYSDFNGPNERSWKLKYAYDFVGLGLPGLTSAVSYISGKTDLTKVDPQSRGYASWYSADGKNAKHWERDIDLKYVVQDGKAKDLAVRLQWATHRGGNGYSAVDRDVDEYRVIVDYPIDVF